MVKSLGRVARNEQIYMSALAVFAGALGGGAGIAFRELIALVQFGTFGFASEFFHSNLANIPWWHILMATTGGGLLVGLIVHFLMPERRPQGVADVVEAAALKGGRLNYKSTLGAAATSAITIGTGGSSGREGPVVHLAACLTGLLSERLHLDRAMRQTLLGCGVAAGVAASFNAPMAGVFFALEVVMGSYALASFAPVVIASVTGTIVTRIYFGDFPAFTIPPHDIASFWEFPAFALLGIVSAFAAIAFVWSVGFVRKTALKMPVPAWSRPAFGGLVVGSIGIFFPQILGVGYEATDEALNEVLTLQMLIILAILKTAATAVTLGTGGAGGVFSPSLFVGAMIGGAFGVIATEFQPHLSSGHGAYTLIGIGAVAGAVLGAPMSTILMVFELTGDYAVTIGVMIATVISSQIMMQVFGRSFFTWQLQERGVNLSGGREATMLRSRLVADIMRSDHEVIPHNARLDDMREKLVRVPYGELFVTDHDGRLMGTITLAELSDAAFDHSYDSYLIARDVVRTNPPLVTVSDNLEQALTLLQEAEEEHIAVVDSRGSRKLVGVLHERDLLVAYQRSVRETRG